MIRWSYLLPRLLLLAAALAALHFGLSPLARLALIQLGPSLVGGKVDVGDTHVALLDGRVVVRDLAVTDPRSPLRNLVEFESGEFEVDREAFWMRRFVVHRGTLRGLQFDTARSESGALAGGPDADGSAWSQTALGEAGEQWLNDLGDRLDTTLEEELETVRLSKELMRRWPAEYRDVELRLRDWQARAERLRQVIQQPRPPQGNLLQQADYYRQQLAEVEALRGELVEFHDRLRRLRQQADHDRVALDAARRRDVEHVREKLRLRQLDPQTLSEYLLGEETGRMVADALAWVQQGHAWLNVAGEAPEVNHLSQRGTLVNLVDGPLPPDWLIRQLDIEGRYRHAAGDLFFRGTAESITHQPRRHDQPLRVQLALSGMTEGTLTMTSDRRAAEARTRFQLECPRMDLPAASLGNAEGLAVKIPSGAASVGCDLQLVGSRITGHLSCRRAGLELTPHVAPQLGGSALSAALRTAVADVREVEMLIPLEGDVRRPRWRLRSNLGTQLAAGVNRAVQAELTARAEQWSRQVDGLTRDHVRQFESLVAGGQSELGKHLQLGQRQLDEFQQLVTRRIGSPRQLLGRELPLPNLLRK